MHPPTILLTLTTLLSLHLVRVRGETNPCICTGSIGSWCGDRASDGTGFLAGKCSPDILYACISGSAMDLKQITCSSGCTKGVGAGARGDVCTRRAPKESGGDDYED